MEYNKFFLVGILILVLCSLSFTLAGTHEIRFYAVKNQNRTISNDCTVNGFPCDETYNCSRDIINPSGTIILSNISLSRQGNYWTNNVTGNSLSLNGIYQFTDYCNNGTLGGKEDVFFMVTDDGQAPETMKSTVYYIFFIIFATLLAIVLFILAIKYDDYLHIFCGACFITAGVMTLIFPTGFDRDFITSSISIILIGLGMVILGVYVIPKWFPEDKY